MSDTEFKYNFLDKKTGKTHELHFPTFTFEDGGTRYVEWCPFTGNGAVDLIIYFAPIYVLSIAIAGILEYFGYAISDTTLGWIWIGSFAINIPFIFIRSMCSPMEYAKTLAFMHEIKEIFPDYEKHMSMWEAKRLITRAGEEIRENELAPCCDVWT